MCVSSGTMRPWQPKLTQHYTQSMPPPIVQYDYIGKYTIFTFDFQYEMKVTPILDIHAMLFTFTKKYYQGNSIIVLDNSNIQILMI